MTRRAEEDLFAAIDFYDLNDPGAGDLLFRAIMRELRRLENLNGFHRKRHGFHKVLTRKFPQGIYYSIFQDEVVVVAIIDERREPSSIRKDLKLRNRKTGEGPQ